MKYHALDMIHHMLPNHFRIGLITCCLLLLSLLQPRESFLTLRSQEDVPELTNALAPENVSVLSETTEEKHGEKSTQVQVLAIGEKKAEPTKQLEQKQGQAKQIDEHTWTITVGKDSRNATASEIFEALNTYRQKKGRHVLSSDDQLLSYAQSRSDQFAREGKLDSHKGFQDFVANDGFNKLGFFALGENSSYGYVLEGTHLIEWVYAGDKPHDDNQLSSEWTHVGIGVSGTATNFIFGGKKR